MHTHVPERSHRSVPAFLVLALGLLPIAAWAAPPVPSQPTATCDATVNGKCYVNGDFTVSSFSAGADHYKICRSNDTTGWGGCDFVMTANSGPSFTVTGANLPSDGFRRAFRFKACDATDDCTSWADNDETYVQMDLTGPTAPGPTTTSCAYTAAGNCWVTGAFVITATPAGDSGSGVERHRICRSNDSPGGFSGCEFTMTWDGGTSYTVSGSHLPSDGFRRSYRFRGIDYVGNQGTWNSPIYVRIDRYNPTVSADNASPDWFTSRTATVSAADATGGAGANSGLAEVRYRWNAAHNGSCTTGTPTSNGAVLTVPQGDNHLYLCARDNTGRVGFWNGGPYRVFGATCPIQSSVAPRPCSGANATTVPLKRMAPERLGDFELHQKLGDVLSAYYLETIDPAKLRQDLDATGRLILPLDGVERELILEVQDLRAPGFTEVMVTEDGEVELPPSPVSTFKGIVAGLPDSKVRLLVQSDLVTGYVELEGRRYFVDPAYKFAAGGDTDRIVVYEEDDLQPAPGISCAFTELERHAELLSLVDPSSEDPFDSWQSALQEPASAIGGDAEKGLSQIREIEIATDADFEYWAIHGSGTNAHIQSVLNMVNGFYEDAGLVFVVTSQRFFTNQSSDPYETCQIFGQWCELWREWELYRQGVQRDVVHLFSGKNLWLDDSPSGERMIRGTSGLFATVCDLDRAYVLSTPYREAGLVAHEIGHALDARHHSCGTVSCANCALCPDLDCALPGCQSVCQQPGGGPVMCGSIQSPTTELHEDSIAEITSYVASSGSCLNLNRAPVAVNDSLTTPQDTGLSIPRGLILGNDSDPDGDPLWLVDYDLVTTQGGTNDTGHIGGFNYTPPAGFVGTDSFTYTISDRPNDTGLENTATVSVVVTPGTSPSVVAPWQDNANGTLSTNIAWNYAMGYHFTPQVTGQVIELGGFLSGTKTVKLFNKSTGVLLAQATVSAANNWSYTAITPVAVQAGATYTVAVYLAGSGGSYRNGIITLPQVYGPVRIDGSTYVSTASDPNARPTNNITTRMYGQADVKFAPN
jgi:hypothetical protein